MAEHPAPSRPDPPSWGAVITAACAQAGLSARAAARQAGISEGRWRQITSGYQIVEPGVYAPVRGPAPTVARMAEVAGLTPAQLRAAGRDDAARLLAAPAAGNASELLRRIRAMDGDQAREVLAQIAGALLVSVAGEAGAGQGTAAHDGDG
jgi:Helix-turn-helix domain